MARRQLQPNRKIAIAARILIERSRIVLISIQPLDACDEPREHTSGNAADSLGQREAYELTDTTRFAPPERPLVPKLREPHPC